MRQFFVRYGHLVMLASGDRLPEGDDALYVVQSGIVAVAYSPLLGETQEYYLGTGGVYGLYLALTGECMRCWDCAVGA